MNDIKFQPVIKWTGSKRSQVVNILSHFPKEIDTYYEPFCGGASVLYGLLKSNIKVNSYILSDLNQDLINLWNVIKSQPQVLGDYYEMLWTKLNEIDEVTWKSSYFNMVRDRFNKEHNPMDFFFLLRTCFNGMVRYSKDGKFNTSYHLNRNGMLPSKMKNIINEWSKLLNDNNIEFICCDYKEIHPKENDFVYLDPPYNKTKGLYFGGIDNKELFEYLGTLNCGYILSYDGFSGDKDSTVNVPRELFDEHLYISSGNSSFKRIVEVDDKAIVRESLYIKKGKNSTFHVIK